MKTEKKFIDDVSQAIFFVNNLNNFPYRISKLRKKAFQQDEKKNDDKKCQQCFEEKLRNVDGKTFFIEKCLLCLIQYKEK